jgi:rod shape-determining protein MreC
MMSYRREIRVNPIGTIMGRLIWSVFILLVAWYIFFPTNFSKAVLYIAQVLWDSSDDISQNRPLTSRAELISENERLKYLFESIKGDLLASESRKVENDELKSALNRANSITKRTVLAAVLARPPYTLYDNLVVDVGTDNGIKVGALVFVLGTTTEVGRVAVVNENQSIVKLHSSPSEEFDVLVGPNHVMARATGKGNGAFQISLPRDSGVNVGDFVVSPNISSNYISIAGSQGLNYKSQ